MALLEAFRTEKALHLRDSVTGRMRAIISIHDQFFHDGTGLVAVEEPARLDGVEGFARKADRMRHIIRYGDNGTRRWYPRRSALNEYIEFGRPEYWTGTQWSLLPMGTPTADESWGGTKLVWDRPTYALTVQHNWHRVKLDVTLKPGAVARRIRWPVTLQGLAFSNWTLISQSDGKIVGYINKPTAEDANGKVVPVTASYSAGYVEFNADLTGAVYPVVIDPTFTDGYGGDATTSKDNEIINWGTLDGTGAELRIGEFDVLTDYVGRGLFQFDVSSIPSTATIDSAHFYITPVTDQASTTGTWRVYRLKRAWSESQSSWTEYSAGNNWQTAGGFGADDCEQTHIATADKTATETLNTEWDFTLTAGSGGVQDWVDGSFANNGILVKVVDELNHMYIVASSDHATTGYRPYLTVVYTTGGAIAKNVNEILQLVEANRRVFAFRRPLAEIVQVAEARSRNLTMTRNKAETVIISEAPARSLGLLRRLTETIRLLEATKSSRRLLARVAEIVQTVETSGKGIATSIVRNIAEAIQIAETISRFQGLVRALSESLPLGEVSRRNLTLRRTHSETMQIAEVQSRPMAMFRRLAETFQISETAYKAARWLRLVSETVQIGESVSRIRGFFKTIAETLQIIEASNHAFRQAQALVKYVSETLQLLEVASRVKRPLGHLSIDIQRGYARIQVSGRQLAVNIQRGLLRIWHNS